MYNPNTVTIKIDVLSNIDLWGNVTPKAVVWFEGERYYITDITGRYGARLPHTDKAVTAFYVLFGNHERILYLDDYNRAEDWYIEIPRSKLPTGIKTVVETYGETIEFE